MGLYLKIISLRFARRMAYRADFLASIMAFFISQITAPIFVGVVYYAGGTFPGWTLYQVLLLQGIVNSIRGFSFMTFFGILWNSEQKVHSGTLDLLLIRPVNTLRMLVMESFDEEDIGQFLGGLAVTLFALYNLDISVSFYSFILFSFFVVLGLCFWFSIALICSALVIRLIKTGRLYEFVYIIITFASYPKSIYSKNLSMVFTAVLPLLIAGFFPASALLGFPLEGAFLCSLAVVVFLTLSLIFWHRSLKCYAGAGG